MPDYALMNQRLYEGNAPEVAKMTEAALAEGLTPQEILSDGLIAGMAVVGEDFKHNILYVPEVLIAARAMKAGMAVLKPLLSAGDEDGASSSVGRLLMGTVRGDLHDIGKNLVCMMAEGAGFEVKDIGVDQSVEKFIAAADEFKPHIVGMSALLTTTMTYMNTVIEGFENVGKTDIKFAIGGAPISQMFADEIGADGYGADASSAVDLFLYLVGVGEKPVNTKALPEKTNATPEMKKGRASAIFFQVLSWQGIPSEIKAWDETGDEMKVEMPARFADAIDASAQKQGLTEGEAYLSHFSWSEEEERTGSLEEVVKAVQAELEAAHP
jgi:5-methyltetrahydrofolate--homocysteine methyltransferase